MSTSPPKVDTLFRDSLAALHVSQGTSVRPMPAPLRQAPQIAVGRGTYVYNNGVDADILQHSRDRCLIRRVRVDGILTTVPTALYDSLSEALVARFSNQDSKAAARRLLQELPRPQFLPAWRQLHIDAEGFIWAERYRLQNRNASSEWVVFSSEGKAVGTVLLPELYRVWQIGSDFILAMLRESGDFQTVVRYQLARLGGESSIK